MPRTPRMPTFNLSERRELAQRIKEKVESFSLTYVWLVHRLADAGVLTDKFELSATLSCTRVGPKADEILRVSYEILNTYESSFAAAEIT